MTVKTLARRAYLIAVHLALLAAVVKLAVNHYQHQEPDSWIDAIWSFQRVTDTQVPAGADVFLGDSITATLAPAAVSPLSVNFGIGGQRAEELLRGLGTYASLPRARRIFVMIGTNDVREGKGPELAGRYRELLARLPAHVPVVMSTIPPLAEKDTGPFAVMARNACAADARCTLVDLYAALSADGKPRTGMLQPDGVHLSPTGYAVWIALLNKAAAGHHSDP